AWTDSRLDYTPSASASGYGANPQNTGVMRPIPTAPAPSYGKPLTNLPPYVLRPEAYDDCTTIMKRVRTSQPVVLAFAETDMEIAKRILDFCFGFACGINGRVEELGEKTFAILPEGVELTKAAYDKLIRDGVIEGSVE
ncbi:MAG: cell division protein SepF, partial [Atopobiaceae bacterium]|nr:cell division protein SepF [Atopobiaceae bacterium]